MIFFTFSKKMKLNRSKSIVCNLVKTLLTTMAFPLAFGCGKEKDEVVRLKVAETVQDFRQKKTAECREILLREAEEIVDSLLLTEATEAMSDSLARLRPSRPIQPPRIPPIDSLQVRPIFEAPQQSRDTGKKGG
jgi:hypothetical protein